MNRTRDRSWLAIQVHEVRSPVAALAALAEAIAGGLDDGSRRELARLAIAACRGIERVVSDSSLATVRSEEVDLGGLVRDAVDAAVVGGARVEARIAADLPVLEGDPIRLRQALDNLVSNAVIHGEAEAAVVVAAAVRGPFVHLTVSDSGVGIAAEDQTRIFQPGVRLAEDRPGSGLGLAVTRTIVEAHGGTLSVSSAPGEGASFTIRLPLPH